MYVVIDLKSAYKQTELSVTAYKQFCPFNIKAELNWNKVKLLKTSANVITD